MDEPAKVLNGILAGMVWFPFSSILHYVGLEEESTDTDDISEFECVVRRMVSFLDIWLRYIREEDSSFILSDGNSEIFSTSDMTHTTAESSVFAH